MCPFTYFFGSVSPHFLHIQQHSFPALRSSALQAVEVDVMGIVDLIRAGDAFAAGGLAGHLAGVDSRALAEAGLALTALKHSLPGDASRFGQADLDAFHGGGLDVRR